MPATGRYRIERLIGRGGAAEVYEASIVGLGGFLRRVAIKRLRPEVARDPAMVREFEAEARLVSRLHHANVVGVLDFGTMDGLPFQVLEYVDGVDLLALEGRARKLGAQVSSELWVAAVAEAAHGLDYVHHASDPSGRPLGLVHRDITPSNVLVAWSGDVKVADFGIALSLETREPTRVGVVKGKLEYIAPEVLRGDAADPRADVFALGCVLHRMTTGVELLPDEAARRRIAAGEPAPVRGAMAPELARLIGRATTPDAARRCPSAAAFAEDCARYLSSHGVIDGRLVLRETMSRLRPSAEAPPQSPLAAWARMPGEEAYASGIATVPPIVAPRPQPDPEETLDPSVEPRSASPRPPAGDQANTVVVMPELLNRLADEAQPRTVLDAMVPGAPTRDPAERPRPPAPPPQSLAPAISDPRSPSASGDSSTGDAQTTHDSGSIPMDGPPFAYELLEPIAEGGFATVLRARHRVTGEIVALKALREDRRDHKVAPARFEREAHALRKLDSPYLVRVRDVGRMPDGRPFLTMDLLAGRTLADEINMMRGPLPLARTRRLARDMALGLAALHEADIVHRDLGAKNVMVVESAGREKAMLIDLGHMRWIDERPHTQLTAPGLMLGNSRWMAPEQVFEPSTVGPTADLYSLGLLILAMTTGRPPFTGSPATVLRSQLEVIPEIPPGPFATLIRRLVDKDPQKRIATATQVVAELTQIQVSRSPEPSDGPRTSGQPAPAVPPPLPNPARASDPPRDELTRAEGPTRPAPRRTGDVSPRGPTDPGPRRSGISPLAASIALFLVMVLVWALWGLFG